jgi:phage terminase large subunit-like protein
LIQLKTEFEQNQDLKTTYPEIFYTDPRKESPKWSEEKGICVKRLGNPKEATVEAHGLVDGQPTGAHFALRVYDDVVTLESVSTPEQVKKTTDAWALSDNLGARGEDGKSRRWHVGTRYSYSDTYQDILDKGVLKPRIFPATHNGLPDGNPVFLSPEVWAEKKRTQGSAILAAQMLQNPAAGQNALFRKEWLRFQDVRPATLNVYILVDPASSRKRGSDRTAMAVIGIDAAGNKWLMDGYHHRMPLKERWQRLNGLRKVWTSMPGVQIVRVGYEKYGMQSDIEYFEEEMRREKDEWEIVELNWPREGGHAKYDRIQRLEPDFRSGRFLLSAVVQEETANQRRVKALGQAYRIFTPVKRTDENKGIYSLNKTLIDEFLVYPFSAHDDMLDCCSRIYDIDATPPILIAEDELEPECFADGV